MTDPETTVGKGTSTLILVALDGSPRAAGVLNAAVDLARGQGAKLHVLHVVAPPVDLPPEALPNGPDSLAASLLTYAAERLTRAVSAVPSVLLAHHETRLGTPWHVICAVAGETHAALVVVGTHGYHGFDRLLGTTAARVVNHAPCSVLVVREPAPG